VPALLAKALQPAYAATLAPAAGGIALSTDASWPALTDNQKQNLG
jgi:hypothetical protein